MSLRPSVNGAQTTSETSYPTFEPHITLLSLPAESSVSTDALRSAAQKCKNLSVSFKSVDISDHFFRSVLVSIAPTQELWDMHSLVHGELKQEPRTPMYPHMSLCYITNEDAERGERQRFYNMLDDGGRIKSAGAGVALDCAPEGARKADWVSGFKVKEIWIAECNGPVDTWTILDKVQLR
ncbi:hypothetical protein CYLTODRAFT_254939 [Cylindrobasidium torrendii FP15055 ss-10]|uniref:LigT-like protein n=1 Tax=Cylindrobasidium torrendii FP15055 ss-10 TaxID=1314674 RepID=A0A0D7BU48_9AGAR|nr:hypothetical protein CYLTODRAFT_254939 [Cylindrobasidium torrendii FP15055 ss-10]